MGSIKQVRPIEVKSLPQGVSAQLAEPVVLTRALGFSNGQWVNIYTDSKYAYLTLHAHAAICKKDSLKWQERNLLSISERSRNFEPLYIVLIYIILYIPIPKKGNAIQCSNYCTNALISHASKVMLKILQARLQQYVNCEPDVQAEFRKGRRIRDQVASGDPLKNWK